MGIELYELQVKSPNSEWRVVSYHQTGTEGDVALAKARRDHSRDEWNTPLQYRLISEGHAWDGV